MRFEWDEVKATKNLAKHGIDFRDAVKVFRDRNAVEDTDRSMDYGEERYFIIGMVGDLIITVFFVERGERTRIISARPASRTEQRTYDDQRKG